MAATIEVNKQSVKALLSSGIEHPFIIPEYQRPYAWSFDQVDTLFKESQIAVTKALSQSSVEEWGLDDITERDIHISEKLLKLLETWSVEYNSKEDSTSGPTPEQLEMIRQFRENGWV